MASTAKILLIEDDPGIVMTLRRVLTEEGHQVQVETRGDNGLKGARGEAFDVVITDMKLPGLSGLDLVRELHGIQPRLPIILITAHGTTETAIEATKAGAYDYLLKPFEIPELIDLVEKAVASRRDRKSTRLNSSHDQISYAVFCLKKKNQQKTHVASRPQVRRGPGRRRNEHVLHTRRVQHQARSGQCDVRHGLCHTLVPTQSS